MTPRVQMMANSEEAQAEQVAANQAKYLKDFLNSLISDGQTDTMVNGFTIRREEDGSINIQP